MPAGGATARKRSASSKDRAARPRQRTRTRQASHAGSHTMDFPILECPHIRGKAIQLTEKARAAVLNPLKWLCERCGTTDGIWACLKCGHVGCGRDNDGHGQKHFEQTGHPLVLEITSKYIHCYLCDNYVMNDTDFQELAQLRNDLEQMELDVPASRTRSGRPLRGSRGVESEELELDMTQRDKVDTALRHWQFSELGKAFNTWRDFVAEQKEARAALAQGRPATPKAEKHFDAQPQSANRKRKRSAMVPGMTGLRNLGQTCFMNVILQAFSHLNVVRVALCELGRSGLLSEIAPPSSLDQSDAEATEPAPPAPRRRKSQSKKPLKKSGLHRQSTIECHSRLEKRAAALAVARRRAVNVTEEDKKAAEELLNSEVHLCPNLESLFRVMWSGRYSVVTPRAILAGVWQLIPAFRGFKQQDAQELLIEMQECLLSELNRLQKQQAADGDIEPLIVLLEAFDGLLCSEVRCLNCDHLSQTRESFCALSLDFPPAVPRHVHLCDMLKSYTTPETFGDPIYKCDGCSQVKVGRKISTEYRDATKTTTISRLPGVLHLHLKRFRWSGIRREKIQVSVTFPLVLDMRPYCADDVTVAGFDQSPSELGEEGFLYDLVGVIVHDGRGINSGHYRCYCYNTVSASWIHCNDARVNEVGRDTVTQAQAYILFYSHRLTASQRLMSIVDKEDDHKRPRQASRDS